MGLDAVNDVFDGITNVPFNCALFWKCHCTQ
jgi:hypothetical protein